MFKKPLNNLKTSAPLRSSDRRKLKHRIVQAFPLDSEDGIGDLLVPEGLLSVKFITHLDEPGIAYLAPNGDPLWITIGKGSDDHELIPTVYSLWKHPALLPFISTPSAVVPVLVGGADLMIPGVVQHTPSLKKDELVSIVQYDHEREVGTSIAIGRMALDMDGSVAGGRSKGKAVHVLHTWKDHLWDLGTKGDLPVMTRKTTDEEGDANINTKVDEAGVDAIAQPEPETKDSESTYTPQEVSSLLRTSLLQAIYTTLSKLPASSFPISATNFYSLHILPSRPCLSASSPKTPIDIKHSTFKSLTVFLKQCDKEGLIKIKETKSEIVVTGVFPKHVDVVTHRPYVSIKAVDAKREKQEEKAQTEKAKVKEMTVTEMWKPHQQTVKFFEGAGHDPSALYTLPEIKHILNTYITNRNLVNPREQQYINLDELLRTCLISSKSTEVVEFLKRDEVVTRVVDKLQSWYEIDSGVDGRDAVLKKGQLKPISVVIKIRQGRKASTLITNFESYSISADFLADELRRICASATSVSAVQGLGKNSTAMEVLVQGKQMKSVVDLLLAQGVPRKWIEGVDLSDKKK